MASSGSSVETFARDLERVRGGLAGADSRWLTSMRRRAMEALAAGGFPTVRDEDWKYTSVLPVLRDTLEPVLPDESRLDAESLRSLLSNATGLGADATCIVFVDGNFRAPLSRIATGTGVRVSSLRDRLEASPADLEPWLGKYLPADARGFAALNTAFLDDGAVIEIVARAQIEKPIHVVYLATARERAWVAHPRDLIVAHEGCSAVVVEQYLGESGGKYLTNAATEISVGANAVLGHLRIQDEAQTAFHVARVEVEQAAGSTLVSHTFGFGAALSRTEIAVKLAGEEAECRLSGLYLGDGSRHLDHHLHVDHARPRTRSEQLYKGVLEDKSRGVFTGRVVVRAGAQKIKATQKNPSLLLGAGAVAETRPQLEIHADDVQCNHGATIGRLSEDALFYLLSRGIDAREARRILVAGFAAEVVEGVVPPSLRAAMTAAVAAQIATLGDRTVPGTVPGTGGAR